MNKILKSYLKTFYKNWLSTIFIVFFIIILSTSVIGMLATPLQIYSKMLSAQKENVAYDSMMDLRKTQKVRYSEDFLTEYIYLDHDDANNQYLEQLFIDAINYKHNIQNQKTSLSIIEKTKISESLNSAFSAYRNGANNVAISYKVDSIEPNELETTKQQIINLHIQKSIKQGWYEFMNILSMPDQSITPNELNSIGLGIIYRIFSFTQVNGIKIDLPESSIEQVNDVSKFLAYIKEFYASNQTNINSWNPKIIYFSSYVIFKDDIAYQLADPQYQHDDRLLVFNNFIQNYNQKLANENHEAEYQLLAQKNLSFTNSSNILKDNLTIDLRADANYKLMSQQDNKARQFTNFNNLIFDKKHYNQSRMTSKWINPQDPEIVVSSAFAKANKLKVGDMLELPGTNLTSFSLIAKHLPENVTAHDNIFASNLNMKIVGIGQTFDDYVPGPSYSSFSQSIDEYALGYANINFIEQYRNYSWKYLVTNESSYTSTIKIKSVGPTPTGVPFAAFNLANDVKVFSSIQDSLIPWSDSKVATSLSNLKIRIIVYIILGVIILILAFIFINFNLKKEINETRKQLGIFKSFGYRTNELSWIFAIKTLILFFVSISIGVFVSFPMQSFAARGFLGSVTIDFAKVYLAPGFLVSLIIGVPLLFFLISYLTTLYYLNEKPLSLINNSKKAVKKVKTSFLFTKIFKGEKFFNWRLRRAFVKNSKGKFYMVQILFALSSLTYILIFGAQTIMTQSINQAFALYNDHLDHYYDWDKANSKIDVDSMTNKYNWKTSETEPLLMQYQDYYGYKNVDEYLTKHNQSEIRYQISALTQMTGNYYNQLSSANKFELILPENELNYLLQNTFGATNLTINPIDKDEHQNLIDLMFDYNLNQADIIKGAEEIKETGFTSAKINPFAVNKNSSQQVTIKNLTPSQESNIFYNDFLQIFSVKIMQTILTYSLLPTIVDPVSAELFTDVNALGTAMQNLKSFDYGQISLAGKSSKLLTTFNPLNHQQWSLVDNPLFNDFEQIFKEQLITDQQIITGLLTKNFSQAQIALFNGLMLSNTNSTTLVDKMISVNTVYFDKSRETLTYNMEFKQTGQYDDQNLTGYMLSPDLDQAGDFGKVFNFTGINEVEMNNFINPSTQEISAIIPYYMHKSKKYEVGDIIEIKSNTTEMIPIKIKVVGINKSQTLKADQEAIWLNYDQFKQNYFAEQLSDPIFSSLFSLNPMLEGEIKFNDIVESIQKIKFAGDNLTISMNGKKTIFSEIFNEVFSSTILSKENDPNLQPFKLITNPNLITAYSTSSIPMNITKAAINEAMKIVNRIMLIFVLLTTVLLSIILIVIMGIVVDEARTTILTMLALGYKSNEVNWTVMGSYIIGVVISFVAAYLLSVLIWKAVLWWVGMKFSVYIFMGFDLKSILITISVMSIVMLFGWYTANKQVTKIPLTQITSIA